MLRQRRSTTTSTHPRRRARRARADADQPRRHRHPGVRRRRGEPDRCRIGNPSRRAWPACVLRGAHPAVRRGRGPRRGDRLLRPNGRFPAARRGLRARAARDAAHDAGGHGRRGGSGRLHPHGRGRSARPPVFHRLLHRWANQLPPGRCRPRPDRRHGSVRLAGGSASDRPPGTGGRGATVREPRAGHLRRRRPRHPAGGYRGVRSRARRRRRRTPHRRLRGRPALVLRPEGDRIRRRQRRTPGARC